ncbi:MAG: FAD-binding oxidoreductase [Thaumarchaeota archaeon]|nr:FAD-binding oxidoreductase [Nitrososphaerota archaeon]
MHSEFIILGAGISGISTSYFLEKSGFSSIILDISNPLSGSGSTMKSAGIISHFFPFKEEIKAVSNSLKFYDEIINDSSENISYNNSGLLAFCHNSDKETLSQFLDAMKSSNADYSLFDSKELSDIYPMLSMPSDEIAVISKNSGYYDIDHLFPIILKQLKSKNINFFNNIEIKTIERQNYFTFHTNHGIFTSDKVIITGGAWSNKIANMFNCTINFDTYSTRAAIFSIPQASNNDLSSLPILYKMSNGVYGRPVSSSSFLFGDGSTKYSGDPNNFKFENDKNFLEYMLQQANTFFPNQKVGPVQKNWSGLYTSSEDSRPLIGKLDDDIFFLGCFNGLGIMLAPGCSKLLVDSITKNIINDDFSSFNIQRFNNNNI